MLREADRAASRSRDLITRSGVVNGWLRSLAASASRASRRSSGPSPALGWCSCPCADLWLAPTLVPRRIEPFDTRGDHLGEAPRPGSAPVEAANELSVHEDRITLGDRVQHRTTDRGVPRRDREREQAPACLRNGNAKLGDLMYPVGYEVRRSSARNQREPSASISSSICTMSCRSLGFKVCRLIAYTMSSRR